MEEEMVEGRAATTATGEGNGGTAGGRINGLVNALMWRFFAKSAPEEWAHLSDLSLKRAKPSISAIC